MHRLSLFFGLLASIIPSLAAPTPFAPLYKCDGPVAKGRYIVKVRIGIEVSLVLGVLGNLPGANTVSHQWDSDFYNAFAGLSIRPRARVILGPNQVAVGEFDQNAIDTLRSSPDVEYIAEDGIMSTFGTQYVEPPMSNKSPCSNTSVRTDAPWNLARISTPDQLADQNPSDLDFTYNYEGSEPGSGVDIYVVDTGLFLISYSFTGVFEFSFPWQASLLLMYAKFLRLIPGDVDFSQSDFGNRARWGGTFCEGCKVSPYPWALERLLIFIRIKTAMVTVLM